MDAVEDLSDPQVPISQACSALGLSRATLYRQTQPAKPPASLPRPPSPRRLSDVERQAVLDVLHTEEFVDQPPAEVHARLLSRGVYLASVRTMYRNPPYDRRTASPLKRVRDRWHPVMRRHWDVTIEDGAGEWFVAESAKVDGRGCA